MPFGKLHMEALYLKSKGLKYLSSPMPFGSCACNPLNARQQACPALARRNSDFIPTAFAVLPTSCLVAAIGHDLANLGGELLATSIHVRGRAQRLFATILSLVERL